MSEWHILENTDGTVLRWRRSDLSEDNVFIQRISLSSTLGGYGLVNMELPLVYLQAIVNEPPA